MKWRARATADIYRLYSFLYEKNPDAARRAARAIFEGAEILDAHPRIGRPMQDDTERREWLVTFGSSVYVLRYSLDGEVPIILRVWHSRKQGLIF